MYKGSFRSLAFAMAATVLTTAFAQAQLPAGAQPAVARPAAAASGPAALDAAKAKAGDQQRGTIGTITDLAQQLKVEQLKRDLREAKQGNGNAENAGFKLPPAGAIPSAAAVKVSAASTERTPPSVAAILGMGGRLRARLHDGREFVAGQEVQGWAVTAVTPTSVTFSQCATAAKKGASGSECITRSVAPTAG